MYSAGAPEVKTVAARLEDTEEERTVDIINNIISHFLFTFFTIIVFFVCFVFFI